jgi:hypothetical protein
MRTISASGIILLILFIPIAIAMSLLIPFIGAYCLWILFPAFFVGNKFWARLWCNLGGSGAPLFVQELERNAAIAVRIS